MFICSSVITVLIIVALCCLKIEYSESYGVLFVSVMFTVLLFRLYMCILESCYVYLNNPAGILVEIASRL